GARAPAYLPTPPLPPGRDAVYEIDEEFALADVAPMIAKPYSPGNAFPAGEVARERLTFDKALIGSCTNGGYDDLLQAALVLDAARGEGFSKGAKDFALFPRSRGVGRQIESPGPRPHRESIAGAVRSLRGP